MGKTFWRDILFWRRPWLEFSGPVVELAAREGRLVSERGLPQTICQPQDFCPPAGWIQQVRRHDDRIHAAGAPLQRERDVAPR